MCVVGRSTGAHIFICPVNCNRTLRMMPLSGYESHLSPNYFIGRGDSPKNTPLLSYWIMAYSKISISSFQGLKKKHGDITHSECQTTNMNESGEEFNHPVLPLSGREMEID